MRLFFYPYHFMVITKENNKSENLPTEFNHKIQMEFQAKTFDLKQSIPRNKHSKEL